MSQELHVIRDLMGELSSKVKQRVGGIDDRVLDLEKRMGRASIGGVPSLSSGGLPPQEHKAVEQLFRTWISGDARAFDAALGEVKTMQAGVDSQGGFFVPIETGRAVRRMTEVAPIIAEANTVMLRQGMALEGIEDINNFEARWVSELQARPETAAADVGRYRVELAELYAAPTFSQTLIGQAEIDIVGWATDKIFRAFALAEETSIISGTGVGRPRGITTYATAATGDDTRPWGTFQHVATGASGAFASSDPGDCLIELALAIKPEYRPNAKWYMSRAAATAIRKMKPGTSDEYLWQPGLQYGQPDMLLGTPIVYVEALPAICANSLSVWYGDFRQCYTVVRRPGIRLLQDPYSNKPLVMLYAIERVGGAAINSEAFKALKFAAS